MKAMEKSSNSSKKMSKSESKSTPTTTAMSTSVTNKTTPKDAQIVAQILKDMAITEYEPRVVHQMIEFTYRYVSNVLEDAHLFSSYGKKKAIDCDDISLAIQLQVDKGFTGPPPRDLLLEIARNKNGQTLPAIKSHNGPRLPADRYSLIACNYKQKSNKLKAQNPQQVGLPFRSTSTGTSLLNSTNSSSVLKPISSAAQRIGSQSLSLKTSDSQSLKRKLEDS